MADSLILLAVFLICLIPTNYLLKILSKWQVPSLLRTIIAVIFLFFITGLAAKILSLLAA